MRGKPWAAAKIFPALILIGLPHFFRLIGLVFRLRAPKRSLRKRLADFPTVDLPVGARVEIRFDDHQIPFVHAESDADAAFAIGMLQAHLRLGQMEITRRLARGRMAAILGFPAVGLDHSLRCLGLTWAIPEMEKSLPPATRMWMERFVEGVNTYQSRMRRRPMEFSLLRIPIVAWTVSDVLAVERLAAADVNWVLWLNLLGLRQAFVWRVVWRKILELGMASPASFTPEGWTDYFPKLLAGVIRSGSNSFAAQAPGGKAFLASDPHLGVIIPNVWMLAGYQSPSYHGVGLMLPGLPFLALGRNARVAWGGTNMYAASSDLVDVSELSAEAFTTRREVIAVRGWLPKEIDIRSTRYGPVVSDAPLLKRYRGGPLCLRWMGHQPSDEISAFLAANRASNWLEFKNAFATYAVSGMNIVYADADGNVGQVMAVRLPMRPAEPPLDLVVTPAESDRAWSVQLGPAELPAWLNPRGGAVVSANNPPAPIGFPVGYLFPPGDRHSRIQALLQSGRDITLESVKSIQADVYSLSADRLRHLLARRMRESGAAENSSGVTRMVRSLEDWDGCYRADSTGAAAFQLMLHAFALPHLRSGYGPELSGYLLSSEAFFRVLEEELTREPGPGLLAELRRGATRAYPRWRRFPTWGSLHRMRPAHPLRILPGIGRFFQFGNAATEGSSQTVMKSAHAITQGPHEVTYGAVARHVSDLSDPDENYFALLGGQDGWLLSDNSLDLWKEWRRGAYVKIPLRWESIQRDFPNAVRLEAKTAGA